MSLQALLWKDLRREWASREGIQAGLVLVALFLVLYLFAFDDLSREPATASVVMWAPLVWAAAAVAGRGTASEADRGTLQLLQLAPVDRVLHGVSRTLVDLLLILVLAAASLLLGNLVFAIPLSAALAAAVGLGAIGLAVVGSLAGALAAQARARDLLLPLLLVPVIIPLLQAGLVASQAALAGAPDRTPYLLLAGYDLIACGVAWLLWPHVLDAD